MAVATTPRRTRRAAKTDADSAAPPKRRKNGSVMIYGEVGKNRHFVLDSEVADPVEEKVSAVGVTLAEVCRTILKEYADGASEEARSFTGKVPPLPPMAVAGLSEVWATGDQPRINAYMAALYDAGWPLRSIGDGMEGTGLDKTMSRQAVHLRVEQVDPEHLPTGLPDVPEPVMRRFAPLPEGRRHDFSFRIADSVYEVANRRATFEASTIAVVLEDGLRRRLSGEVDVVSARATTVDADSSPADT
jgi:hypothetical protein